MEEREEWERKKENVECGMRNECRNSAESSPYIITILTIVQVFRV